MTIESPRHVAALSVAVAAESAGDLSVDMIAKAIKAGDLKAKRYGRRVLIRPVDLDEFIDSLPDAGE